MYSIEQYNISHYSSWNDFIAQSKNGTFLFHRDYMEYHSDRFEDFSLLVFEGKKLIAVFPANREGKDLHSHKGLTYGGLIYGSKMKLKEVIKIYRTLLQFLNDNQIDKLHIKPVPAIYHKFPAQEQEYVMFLMNARLTRRDGLSVISYNERLNMTNTRKQGVKRGKVNGLQIVEEPNLKVFWDEVLIPNLSNKHDAKPVHDVSEIIDLHDNFPQNIIQFNVYYENEVVAGSTVFVTDTVAHAQYISGVKGKNMLGSLDYLYEFIISNFSDKKYFDFGPSTEQQGKKLNEGLTEKEIYEYLIVQYGQWITYDPEFNQKTLILWALPILLFIIGGAIIFRKLIVLK